MRLILLRHAKSDWGDPGLSDKERPLNARGRADAPKIGAWLAQHARPDHILVSTAQRTRETWSRLGLSGAPRFLDALYLAEPAEIAAILPPEGTALVIAHNPGIADAAARFAETPPSHPAFSRYPTAACTILAFEGPAMWGEGRVTDFVVPREL